MADLKILSYNVKGLNSPEKRSMITNELWKNKAKVALLQETHFQQGRMPSLKSHQFPTVYYSGLQEAKIKGTAIMIARTVPWEEIRTEGDPEGRWVMVTGKCYSRVFTFVSIYAPNKGQVDFAVRLLKRIKDFAEGTLIVGGDWNLILEPEMDSSSGKSAITRAGLRRLKKELYNSQMIDPWRILHPTMKDYSYFSPLHNTYSRIDFFLTQHNDLAMIRKATIEYISISDHAPIALEVAWGESTPKYGSWRLNESLLQDPLIEKEIRAELEFYFKANLTPDVPVLITWEAHKAFIRGVLVKWGARKKREHQIVMKKSFNR